MKILGSLYAHSDGPMAATDLAKKDRRNKAKDYLKKAVEQCVDDIELWIDYAQLLEETDSRVRM